ncbi:MAG: VOC family protein, partial [Chitinophagaceae bacterium]|nr:VOC family protein [Chitinophagaceae bacterium]
MKKLLQNVALLLIGITTYTEAHTQNTALQRPVLNHIALYVMDLKTSTSFYQDIIGLDTIPEPFHDGRHTWFSIGAKAHLHIISGAKEKKEHDKNTHLCFSV